MTECIRRDVVIGIRTGARTWIWGQNKKYKGGEDLDCGNLVSPLANMPHLHLQHKYLRKNHHFS